MSGPARINFFFFNNPTASQFSSLFLLFARQEPSKVVVRDRPSASHVRFAKTRRQPNGPNEIRTLINLLGLGLVVKCKLRKRSTPSSLPAFKGLKSTPTALHSQIRLGVCYCAYVCIAAWRKFIYVLTWLKKSWARHFDPGNAAQRENEFQ